MTAEPEAREQFHDLRIGLRLQTFGSVKQAERTVEEIVRHLRVLGYDVELASDDG